MKNILRIKINDTPIGKLSQSDNLEDFYFYYPRITSGNNIISGHFTFHSRTGRATFKTTNWSQDGKETMPSLLNLLRDHPKYRNKVKRNDLDLYDNMIVNFGEKEYYPWFMFGLNMGGTTATKYFHKIKTPDSDFEKIWNIIPPRDASNQLTLYFYIGRKCRKLPQDVLKKYEFCEGIDINNYLDEEYSFFVCGKYLFPELKKLGS